MTLVMELTMLRWKLREVMARENMTNRRLSEIIGIHETNVSNMKRRDTMPRIDGETLEKICAALQCTPFDLLEYSPESVDPREASQET
jgi:putative transcriptional regulator